MSLHLTQQTVTVRRLGGLALSVSFHVATLTLAAYGIVAWRHGPQESAPQVEVTYVSLAQESAVRREPMLIEQANLLPISPPTARPCGCRASTSTSRKSAHGGTCSSRSSLAI